MRSLEPVDARLWGLRSRSARKLLRSNGKISVAIWAALVQAMDWPDTTVVEVEGLVIGFPTVGHYPETGIFRQCDRPAKHAFESLNHYEHNRRLESVLRRLAASDSPRVQQAIEETDRLTRKEVADNNMDGPFYTTEEVDRKLGVEPNSWRALHRFAIQQGTDSEGKVKMSNGAAAITARHRARTIASTQGRQSPASGHRTRR
jgi:hypothetical protein